jgi:hypothetical protein
MEGSIGRTARYVNHEYDTPKQTVRCADIGGRAERPILCEYNPPTLFYFEACLWILPPW